MRSGAREARVMMLSIGRRGKGRATW